MSDSKAVARVDAVDSMGAVAPAAPLPKRDVIASVPGHLRALAVEASAQPWGVPVKASAEMIAMAGRFAGPVGAALAGATDEQRIAVLFPLADIVAKPDALTSGSESEIKHFWAAYHRALAHVPVRVLAGAVDAFMAQAPVKDRSGRAFRKQMPDPGTILDLCRDNDAWKEACAMWRGLERLAKQKPPRSKVELSPEEEAELKAIVDAKMQAFRDRLRVSEANEKAERDANDQQSRIYKRPDGRATFLDPNRPPKAAGNEDAA